MEKDKLISIVIPVYNRAEELKRCLRAIQAQTYNEFEVVIVDDCSHVPMKSVVDDFKDNRFTYIMNNQNGGPSNARAAGWKHCNGEIVVNIDSDWEPYPWMLERIIFYFNLFPDVDAVTGMHLDQNESRLYVRVKNKFKRIDKNTNDLPQSGGGDCVTAAKKYVIDEYLKRNQGYYASEYHLNITFMLKFAVMYIDEPWCRLYIDSVNRVSDTFGKNIGRWINDCRLFLADYTKDLEVNQNFEPLRKQFLNNTIFLVINRQWSLAGEYIKVLKMIYKFPEVIIAREISKKGAGKILNKFGKKKESDTIWI